MKITIVSIILIFLVHHLFVFFKTNLTTPKLKDLVHAPSQKYEAIFNSIQQSSTASSSSSLISSLENTLKESVENESPNKVDMKNELKQFMKKQFKESSHHDYVPASQDYSSTFSSTF